MQSCSGNFANATAFCAALRTGVRVFFTESPLFRLLHCPTVKSYRDIIAVFVGFVKLIFMKNGFCLNFSCFYRQFVLEYIYRAMRGVSDALSSAIRLAEQNAFRGFRRGWLRFIRDVDFKVLCNAPPRTVSDRERSSTKRKGSCAIRLL